MEKLVSMYYDKECLHVKIGDMEFIISETGGFDVLKGSADEINAQDGLIMSSMLPDGAFLGLVKRKIEKLYTDKWREVKSSNIAKVRYVGGDMDIQFANGAVYRYKDVPQETFDELLKAESVGKFFFSKIKGKFEYEEVKENKEESKDNGKN